MSNKLLDKENFENQMHKAIKELYITRKNFWASFLIFIFGAFCACQVSFSQNTVSKALQVTDILLITQLTVFSCSYTAYSIVMTFLQDEYIQVLFYTPDSEYSTLLNKSVTYYESISFLYFIGLALSVVFKIVLSILDENFILPIDMIYNNLISSVLLWAYFVYTFRILYELKSVVKNTSIILRAGLEYRLNLKKR